MACEAEDQLLLLLACKILLIWWRFHAFYLDAEVLVATVHTKGAEKKSLSFSKDMVICHLETPLLL